MTKEAGGFIVAVLIGILMIILSRYFGEILSYLAIGWIITFLVFNQRPARFRKNTTKNPDE